MEDTPGSKAVENLKNLNNSIREFRKPNPPKKNKPKILTEEKYIEELSKIIQRDFFPDLDRLRAQNDYIDAVEKKDFIKMQELRAKYSGERFSERRRSMTPATFETPQSNDGGKTPRNADSSKDICSNGEISESHTSLQKHENKKSISNSHTLDSFLQTYTSEDNYSFQEIIDTADEKLRQKFSVLYNEETLSVEKLARALTVPTIEEQFDDPDPLRKIDTWSYKNKNYIMYIPDGVDLTEQEKLENTNRKQAISHNNTRLLVNPFDDNRSKEALSEIAKTQSKIMTGKVGVDGNVIKTTNMPQIRGFDLVKTPSPKPGEAFSPLMTWGEIEGTPFRLDGSDTPVRSNSGPSFHINQTSRRETIALALAEKVGEKMRAQKQRAMNTARKNIGSPFIRSSMERLASMSPAARHLATSKLGLRSPILTPTSSIGQNTPQTNGAKNKITVPTSSQHKGTHTEVTPKQIGSGKCDLTDNLLKIPTKRLKASDFF